MNDCKGFVLYRKLLKCLRIASNDENLSCHLPQIIDYLSKSFTSGCSYYDGFVDAWCDYFLQMNQPPVHPEEHLAEFIAVNWHRCPVPDEVDVPECTFWKTYPEECAKCILKHASEIKLKEE